MKVCIIGSGLGGLTCGVLLCSHGYEVTVLEQGAQVGGCLQCFSRDGVRFETGMHFIGSAAEGQTMHRVMSLLGLTDDVRLSPLDPSGYEVIGLGGQQYRYANGREKFIDGLARQFPSQRDNLERYYDAVEEVAAASSLASMSNASSTVALRSDYQLRSADSVIEEFISDPLLASVLVGSLPLYAAVRGKTPFATHAFVMDFYNQSAFRIVGGSDAIARSLSSTIERNGGQVLTRQRAVTITCDDSRATGVLTATGDHYAADYIISDIHPQRTLELTTSRLLRPAFRRRVASMEQTVGVFSVYLEFLPGAMPYMNHNYYGYNTPTPWGCEDYDERTWPKGFMYMHFCDNQLTENAEPSLQHRQYATTGVVLSYMQWADVARWADTTVGRRGQDYEDFKERKARQLLQSVERHIPGTLGAVRRYYTSTPLTYRDYTGTERGGMYGIARDISLGTAGRVPHRTKIPNLLLTGQNTNSHGMQGVIVGAIVTCSELMDTSKLFV